LLKGAKAPPSSAEPAADKPAAVSPGMATLLRGGNGDPKDRGQPEAPTQAALAGSARRKRLIKASLIVADVFLFGLAARLVFKTHGHLGFAEAALCIAALVTGAWLTCLALWLD